jgi:hypothetical protein
MCLNAIEYEAENYNEAREDAFHDFLVENNLDLIEHFLEEYEDEWFAFKQREFNKFLEDTR